jgi:glycosyltransferase involved in cell wall biosynthesis
MVIESQNCAMEQKSSRWIACQLGAREHYAIPRALHQQNSLACLCTDTWTSQVVGKLTALAGQRGRSLASRHHPGLPDDLVRHWTLRSIYRNFHSRVSKYSRYDGFIAEGIWFASLVRDWLNTASHNPDIIFSYDTTAMEIFQWAKERGVYSVLGQMDPGRFEADLVAEERLIWKGWEDGHQFVPEAYHARRQAEWELADRIIVNSRWSLDALVRQGVPQEKLRVIPLVYEPNEMRIDSHESKSRSGPLRLLFLGQINLRKGVPYLFEAAKLAGAKIEITMVGPIKISSSAIKSAPSNVRFVGPCSRNDVALYYRNADAFVLPTISDGFAITQLEAMANGLPVIATPNCGEVVSHGMDGLIVPARDSEALATAVLELASNRDMLAHMSMNAIQKSKLFTVERLACDLVSIIH